MNLIGSLWYLVRRLYSTNNIVSYDSELLKQKPQYNMNKSDDYI